jgi:O-antigen/teichoic acid export membrane protein
VFRHASLGTALVLFVTSVFARPLIGLLTTPEYAYAADVIPVVCLAYWFFTLHDHFKTPALLSGRTLATVPAYAVAAAVNVLLNLVLIPRFGAMGAAWASVVTFVVFAFGGLFLYRRIARYEYPIGRSLAVVAAMIATFIVTRAVPSPTAQFIVSAIVSLGWFVALFPSVIPTVAAMTSTAIDRRRLSNAGRPTL